MKITLNDNDIKEEIVAKTKAQGYVLTEEQRHTDGHHLIFSRPPALSELKAQMLEALQRRTYQVIEEKMPQWRLHRWRRYADLVDKTNIGQKLTALEQAEYDCFPDPDETHEDCRQYVTAALAWTVMCINAHKAMQTQIMSATSADDLPDINNTEYPPWEIY